MLWSNLKAKVEKEKKSNIQYILMNYDLQKTNTAFLVNNIMT